MESRSKKYDAAPAKLDEVRRLRHFGRAVKAIALALTVALIIGARAFAWHPQAAAAPDTTAITPAMIDLGRAIFHGKGTCFACHGQKLEGGQIAPTLLPHAWRDAKKGEFAAIVRVVTHGVPSTLMVANPGGINSVEAAAVASYVWSVSRAKAKP